MNLNHFLNELEINKIFYKLNKVREEAIMVEIAVPGLWKTELSNSYPLSDLKDMDKVKLLLSWFENWHDELHNL